MNITIDRQPKCIATLRVEIPADSVNQERASVLSSYSKQAKIPGFRPGKAPIAVIEKRYKNDILEEVEARLVDRSYTEALKKDDLRVLDLGAPTNLSHNKDGSLTFESTIMLAPEITLPEYKGITISVPSTEISEEEIDSQLEMLRSRGADFHTVEREVKDDDFAVIDFTSTLDGKPLEEALGRSAGYIAGREGYWVRIKEDSLLPNFAPALIGLSAGDKKDVAVSIPDDFPVAELRGKEIVIHAVIKEVKDQTLPALDDSFAEKMLGEGKTIADLKELIANMSKQRRDEEIEDIKVTQLIEYFDTRIDFDIPEQLLTAETQSQINQMVQREYQSGASQEDVASREGEIFDAASKQAVTNLKTNFILQEIAHKENLRVSDQELVNHLARMAQSRREPAAKFIKTLQRSGRIPGVRNSMLVNKTLDFLIENATITPAAEETKAE